jgi:hypothetical protein
MPPAIHPEVYVIMRDDVTIMRSVQRAIRRKLDERGISLKVVAADSGIPYNTLCSYFPGNERGAVEKQPAQLPASAIYGLCGAIPDDLLNLVLPEGFAIVRVPSGLDYDEISAGCREFVDAKERAHHPESEAGRDIGPGEAHILGSKFARLRAA